MSFLAMEANEFSIRRATQADIPELARIDATIQASPWTEDHFAQELDKPFSEIWVLTDDATDEKIAGYAVVWHLEHEAHLLTLGVALEYRGLGHGKRLLQHLVKIAIQKQLRAVTLEVRKSNRAALGLYQRHRFTVRHVRKEFYPDGEDAYFMELPLVDDGIDF